MGVRETETLAISSSSNYGSISDDRDLVNEVSASRACEQRSLGRIEVAAFLKMLELGVHSVVKTNLLIEKTCRVDMNLGDMVCDDIEHHPQEQDMVQERVNNLLLYDRLLISVPWWVDILFIAIIIHFCSILISLFVGSYSDKFGRRPLLLVPLIGLIFSAFVYLSNIFFWVLKIVMILSLCLRFVRMQVLTTY